MAKTMSLQLGRVSVSDYKSYRGNVSIDLSLDPAKTITVIHGEMGRGKTTLLEAIYWCLYGEERSSYDSDEGVINNDALRLLRVGDTNETSVEISLHEEGDLRYKIKRSVRLYKKSESSQTTRHPSVGGIPTGIDITETVDYSELPSRSERNDWMVISEPSHVRDMIENLFPKQLASYFLFDAELLDKFFNAGDESNVRDGIEKISGLPILDSAKKHLGRSASAIMKDIKNINLEPYKNMIFHLEQAMEECDSTINLTESELKEVTQEIYRIESFLRNHNEETIQAIQTQRDSLSSSMGEIREKAKKHKNQMNAWLLYSNTVLRLRSTMQDSMEKCNSWEKDGKIPIAVSGHALKNILASRPPVCICGASLHEGSDGRAHIVNLLEKNLVESPVIQSISTGRGHWDEMVEKTKQMRDELSQLRAERGKLNEEYDEKAGSRKRLTKKLDEHDVDDVRAKSHLMGELKARERDLTGTKAVSVEKRNRTAKELEAKNNEYQEQLKREEKHRSQSNQIRLAKTLSSLFSQCNNELIEKLRDMVAKRTGEYFLKLVSKKEDFGKIEILPEYKTVARGHDGKSKMLSAGQSCCLALSYIAAIRDIADKNYFMVIDSPLHNISQEERVDIAKNLPKFIPGTQVTLLVQDQEYTGRAKKDIVGDTIDSVRQTLLNNDSLWGEYLLKSSKDQDPSDVSTHTSIVKVDTQ